MDTALEDVAAAAEEMADDGRSIARRARAMQRRRDRGWSWSKILDNEKPPGVLALLRRLARRSAQTAVSLAAALAHGLTAEGESRRRVARRLGVTHQRVSAILRSHDRDGTDTDR